MRSIDISLLVLFAVFHTGLALSPPSLVSRGLNHWWWPTRGHTSDNAKPTTIHTLESLQRDPENIYREEEPVSPNWNHQLHEDVTKTVQVFAWTYTFIEADNAETERCFVGVRNIGKRSTKVEVGYKTGSAFFPRNNGTRIVYPSRKKGVASYEAWNFLKFGKTPVEIRLYK
ncbi:hypothetical protein CORC01_02217 [Colletotrichum orchidophilum]|uniref:Uncharacterized protein n=1 Tax=Colletotrichum orchidophilum TaxID=1209926 RepID=A0A1G4BM36_9PEZI|nr:uncharacterized protein CORC01_02217 [Colletotrichum orchidophilum]OHF02522.1 hypothetical protein CORC01_02217 [Colletotrichum orchidophilum]